MFTVTDIRIKGILIGLECNLFGFGTFYGLTRVKIFVPFRTKDKIYRLSYHFYTNESNVFIIILLDRNYIIT